MAICFCLVILRKALGLNVPTKLVVVCSLSLSPKRKSYVAPFRQLRETNTSTEVGVVDLVTLRVHHRWMINAPWTIIFHAFLFFTSSSSIKVNLCTKCKIYFSVNYGIVFNLKTI